MSAPENATSYITFQSLIDRIRDNGINIVSDTLNVSTRFQASLGGYPSRVAVRENTEGALVFLPQGCSVRRGVQVDSDDFVSNDDQVLTFNTIEGQFCLYFIEDLLFPDDLCNPEA